MNICMDYYQSLVTEMQPEEIELQREGITYPEFHKYTYYSTTAGRETGVNVLLPPSYSTDRKYPVLYILHGYFDNEDWMARPEVNIRTMLPNLYATGEAREMIIVLPYIYCSKDAVHCTAMNLTNSLRYDNFINDLITDLMPFIENHFSVAKGRENTAITGFSMGGRESLFIGFSHPERFGYIGASCPAPGLVPVADSPMHPGQMDISQLVFPKKEPAYVLLLSAAQQDTVVGLFPHSYRNIFTQNKIEHIWHFMTQTGHDHMSVKPHLYNFFRMIFKETPETANLNTECM